MNRLATSALALAVLVSTPTPAFTDDFADFRIPDHHVLSWTGDILGSASRYTSDVEPYWTRNTNASASLGSRFHRLGDGDQAFSRLELVARGIGQRSSFREIGTFPSLSTRSDLRDVQRSTAHEWSVLASGGRYMGPNPFFAGGSLDAFGGHNHLWRARTQSAFQPSTGSTQEQRTETDQRIRQVRTHVGAQAELGLGRVRDVTGVYLARVIEARLVASGALGRALSHDARQRLADLVYERDDLSIVRDRPAKDLWSEIERIAEADGALASKGIGASSAMRAGESVLEAVAAGRTADGLPASVLPRSRGWRASAVVTGAHDRQTQFSATHSLYRVFLDDSLEFASESEGGYDAASTADIVYAGVQGQWHRPVGLRWQLDAEAYAAVPVRKQDDGLDVYATAQVAWIVADRWLFTANVQQSRLIRGDADRDLNELDQWTVLARAALDYEIEDHLTLRLSAGDAQSAATQATAGVTYPREYRRTQGLELGLTYRFAGRFTAPGFPRLSEQAPPPAGF